MKIAFLYNHGISSILTKFFTGSTCYHVAWVDEEGGHLYDMNLIRRRRTWPCYAPENTVLVQSPVPVSREYLEAQLDSDNNTYGWKDYLLFALRWFYHLVGRSTPNAGGVICSEMIYIDLITNGWPVRFSEVPSPADLEKSLGVVR